MSRNRQVILKSRPVTRPTLENFEVRDSDCPSAGPRELLVRNRYASIEPAMRGWIHEARNYSEPVPLGSVMRSLGVGTVERSSHPDFHPGDDVLGWFGWQEWCVSNGEGVTRIAPSDLPPRSRLGVLGVNGFTAWYGLLRVGRPKEGETVLVSSAAGAVGSAVGQVAKLHGCRVVGLTSSDQKVELCRTEYGFDEMINYKASGTGLSEAIQKACPDGIHVYFDNVGGETLDAVLPQLCVGGRVVVCGTISNEISMEVPQGPRVERHLLVARARMEGFLIMDHFDLLPEAVKELAGWVRSGKLNYREDILDGIERAPEGLLRVLRGENLGKQLIRIFPGDQD